MTDTLWRAGLLERLRIVIAGDARDPLAAELIALGAEVQPLPAELEDDATVQWARDLVPVNALVYDSRSPFASGGHREAVDRAWSAIQAVALGALIDPPAPARIVLIAPSTNAGRHAEAVRAALENLARTLSVEWARHGITTTAIAPGPETTAVQLCQLVAYLLSPAGGYFSGCRFDLGTVA